MTGYDGDAIVVTAIKKGRDRELVEIEDKSGANSVDVGVRYPKRCNGDASVRFEVQVPRGVNFDDHFSSVSGDVHVSGITGRLPASAVSGDVHIKDVSGSVSASAVSGDVSVSLPSSLDADVDMSSSSGSIKTDFPVEVS